MSRSRRPHVGFVLERILGHATHADNLTKLLANEPSVEAEIFGVDWDADGLQARLPLFNSNWTVRAGLRARRGIRGMHRRAPLDSLFIHTQVPAVLARDWLRRIPTVVSLDATPLQYDELGEHYDHGAGNAHVERLKWRANRTCFVRAAHLVTWSAWAKQGLVDGYGIEHDRITVIPPGVNLSAWGRSDRRRPPGDPVRVLFVGGDLERKGGSLLLRSFADLRIELADRAAGPEVELHLVTRSEVPPAPGVTVHHGLVPSDPALIDLYRMADVFCLPTRGDCLPMVLPEAGAAGLPMISTDVAGIPEIVRDGETGLVVPQDDQRALTLALLRLVEAPGLRERLGAGARALVERDHDAEANTHRLVELLAGVATARR
jgi:glycosyltransferase involved in cell wall biosynthesis